MAFFQKIKNKFYRDDPQQVKRELKWLWMRILQYKGKILITGILGLISTVMGLASGVASKYLIDAVTGYGSNLLLRSAVLMVCLMLGGLVLQAISSRVSASIHVHVKNKMQIFFDKMQK